MENTKQVGKNCIKYIVFAGVIYAVLRVVPTQRLSNLEISVLVCVILLGIFSLDCLTKSCKKETMANTKMFDLDLDVDLDFNKSDSTKELATDIKTETNDSSPVSSEKGINMDEIKAELANRNVTLSESNQDKAIDEEIAKNQLIKAEMKAEKAEMQAEKAKMKAEMQAEKAKMKAEKAKMKAEKKAEIKTEMKAEKAEMKSSSINCEIEVSKMRREMEERINKLKEELNSKTNTSNNSKFGKRYLNVLIADLLEKKILEKSDVENLNAKLISGASTLEEVLQSLERLRSIGVPKKSADARNNANDMKYSDLPAESYKSLGGDISNQWQNEYTILNTEKWQVTQPRPPVCISNTPCKVCPTNTEGYPASLKEWDNSRVITTQKISKKWAADQADSKTS